MVQRRKPQDNNCQPDRCVAGKIPVGTLSQQSSSDRQIKTHCRKLDCKIHQGMASEGKPKDNNCQPDRFVAGKIPVGKLSQQSN